MIEVGEYIRTKAGLIFKATAYWLSELPVEIIEDIKAHSKNIIDLIEVGDYVNGEPVEKIERNEIDLIEITTTTEYLVNEKDIETILTHEQYEQNCYKVVI